MPKKDQQTALLILDMLNLFDFEGASTLLPQAKKAALAIAKLKTKFKRRKIPIIYVNDHFGEWQSDWKQIFQACCKGKGREIAEALIPDQDDYFILKPKHSGFYLTALELLLADLEVSRLVITGISGNLCVLFTASDAHMRNFEIVVPKDCIASNTALDNRFALRQIEKVLKLSTAMSTAL